MSELSLEDRVAKLEAERQDDVEKFGHRQRVLEKFETYKREIVELLSKHNEERVGLARSQEQVFTHLMNRLQGLHEELGQAQRKVNVVWNTFNAAMRFFAQWFSGQYHTPTSQEHQGWFNYLFGDWSVQEYEKHVIKAGKDLMDEAIAHERDELFRMRQEKRNGIEVVPMAPHTSTGSVLAKAIGEDLESHKEDLAELRAMRNELNSTDGK